MTRKQLNVNLDELAAAMDMHFDGAVRHFLDTHTGTCLEKSCFQPTTKMPRQSTGRSGSGKSGNWRH